MTVNTFNQPDIDAQDKNSYPAAIDGSIAVMARMAAAFAPHQQNTNSPDVPDMTVRVDAGVIPTIAGIPSEVGAQSTSTITAPSGNPRNDIVYIDAATGTVGVATGAEAASPSDPAVPAGKIAIARIALTVGMTEITNADLTDLRYLTLPGLAAAIAATGLQAVDGQLALDINGMTADTGAIPSDLLAMYDAIGAVHRKITVQNLLKAINGLTADGSPDTAADYLLSYDADAGTVKKVLMSLIGGGSLQKVSTVEAANDSQIDIAYTPSEADLFLVAIEGMVVQTDDTTLLAYLSTDGGSSFRNSGYAWLWWGFIDSATISQESSGSAGFIRLHPDAANKGIGNAAGEHFNALVAIHTPSDAALYPMISWSANYTYSPSQIGSVRGMGVYQTAEDTDAIRFQMDSGNIVSGRFTLFKVTHS